MRWQAELVSFKRLVLNIAESKYRLGSREHLQFLMMYQDFYESVNKLLGGDEVATGNTEIYI